ncbi:hypothetical protein AGMMS50256_20450 [Betaproteobacteria bacterium]|nr:hypothetical protein AGMMS50256_20450 [Betaproteobacteria bacterium]
MEVRVDETGRDDPPIHIENFDGISIQAVLNSGDATGVHSNIHDTVAIVLRVNDQTLLQKEIIVHTISTIC